MRLIISFLFLLTFKVFACDEANTLKPVYAESDNKDSLSYISIYAPSEYDKYIISEISVVVENDFYISSSLQLSEKGYHNTTIQLNPKFIDKAFIVVAYQLKNNKNSSFCGPRKTYELSKIIV